MTQALILKEIRQKTGLSQEKFAAKLDVKVSIINSIECDRGNITLNLLEKIAEFFPELNLDVKYEFIKACLAKELDRLPTQEEINNFLPKNETTIALPRYDIKGAAGCGYINHSEKITEFLNLDKAYINTLNVSTKDLAIIEVFGDSMHPTLNSGDLVIIDLSQKTLTEGVYALCFDDYLLVKRLQFLGDNIIAVKSDNTRYEKIEIDLTKSPTVRIVGKVIATLFQRVY